MCPEGRLLSSSRIARREMGAYCALAQYGVKAMHKPRGERLGARAHVENRLNANRRTNAVVGGTT